MLFEIYYDHNKSAETQVCQKLSYHITDRLLAAGNNSHMGRGKYYVPHYRGLFIFFFCSTHESQRKHLFV